MVLGYFGFGHIIYVSLLFTNAIAILNEERFLAKSEQMVRSFCFTTACPFVRLLSKSGCNVTTSLSLSYEGAVVHPRAPANNAQLAGRHAHRPV
jgi:hypothetical protein